jgi:putative hydrolase of the HAD superfamily
MQWVVFDYGEVISLRTAALPGLAKLLGADPQRFATAYWGERRAYDYGLSDLEYWRAVSSPLGLMVDETTAADLTEADIRGWLDLDQAAVALVEELHGSGTGLALLSNAPSSFGRVVEQQPWARLFRHLMFSGDLGTAKPDAPIWSALLDRLAARPADCLFLDDRQETVDGARAAGLHAERWSGAAAARTVLGRMDLLGEPRV